MRAFQFTIVCVLALLGSARAADTPSSSAYRQLWKRWKTHQQSADLVQARTKASELARARLGTREASANRTFHRTRGAIASFEARYGLEVGPSLTFVPESKKSYPVSFSQFGIPHGFFVEFTDAAVTTMKQRDLMFDLGRGEVVSTDATRIPVATSRQRYEEFAGGKASNGWGMLVKIVGSWAPGTTRNPVVVDVDSNNPSGFTARPRRKGSYAPFQDLSFRLRHETQRTRPAAGNAVLVPQLERSLSKLRATKARIEKWNVMAQVVDSSWAVPTKLPSPSEVIAFERQLAKQWHKTFNCCVSRADWIAEAAKKRGFEVLGKVFAYGDFSSGGSKWFFHVGALTMSEDKKTGERQLLVLDPSFVRGPQPIERWLPTFAKGPVVLEVTGADQSGPLLRFGRR